MTRRSADQIAADRQRLLATIPTDEWVRVPSWASPSDVTALIGSGAVASKVKTEYDRQSGHGGNLFGGSGVVQRRRRYLIRAA